MRHSTYILGRILCFAFLFTFLYTTTQAQSSEPVREVQSILKELGYDPGPVDGVLGHKTTEAIRAYQKDNGMRVDGKYSTVLSLKLQVAEKMARIEKTPEGQARKKEQERLRALSNEELITLFTKADKAEANRLAELIGERVNDLPVSIILNWTKMKDISETLIEFALESLYYPQGQRGIREFQQDLGAKSTGTITFGQFTELARRRNRFYDSSVYVGGFGKLKIYELGGYAKVEGTWIIEGEDIAYPVNLSQIICRKEIGECQVILADLAVPSIDDSDDNYTLLLDSELFSIIAWNKDEIIAEDRGDCRTVLLTLNKNSNEVYEVVRNNKTERCLSGYLTPAELDKPRISRLISGWDVTYKFWQDRQKITSEYLNSHMRHKVKAIDEAMSK